MVGGTEAERVSSTCFALSASAHRITSNTIMQAQNFKKGDNKLTEPNTNVLNIKKEKKIQKHLNENVHSDNTGIKRPVGTTSSLMCSSKQTSCITLLMQV